MRRLLIGELKILDYVLNVPSVGFQIKVRGWGHGEARQGEQEAEGDEGQHGGAGYQDHSAEGRIGLLVVNYF